jgi:hypothetical protein
VRYDALIEQAWGRQSVVAEHAPVGLPAELELQALWFSGAFGRDFTSTTGEAVRILQFGEWNRGAGPDFQHVVVGIQGREFRGSLELDPYASDWENHQHATNPAYRHVVLHVSFRSEERDHFIRNDEHALIPQVIIDDDALALALQRPRRETAIARAGRCVAPLRVMEPVRVLALLREASLYRAQNKARRFLQNADVHGRDAALFQSVAQTLGYRSNALAMQILAQRASLSKMREIPNGTEAILFGSAGFLHPKIHEQATGATREYLSDLWKTWWKHRTYFESSREIPWKMHGHRPANHPHRRVAALALLAQHWPTFRALATARPFRPEPLLQALSKIRHEFWNHHHTLASARSETPIALFGKTQALEWIANHLAPLALLDDPEYDYDAYCQLKALSCNESVRRAGIRLFGSEALAKPWQKSLAHQQALLQVYRDFCLEDTSDCAHCPFPEQLSQWQP